MAKRWHQKLSDIPIQRPGWCRHFECQKLIPDVRYVKGRGWTRNISTPFCSPECRAEARKPGGYLWLKQYSPATLDLLWEHR